jgi:hypothetical protein
VAEWDGCDGISRSESEEGWREIERGLKRSIYMVEAFDSEIWASMASNSSASGRMCVMVKQPSQALHKKGFMSTLTNAEGFHAESLRGFYKRWGSAIHR